jgi:hypothetical protein
MAAVFAGKGAWLRHPWFHLHFTSTSASRLLEDFLGPLGVSLYQLAKEIAEPT